MVILVLGTLRVKSVTQVKQALSQLLVHSPIHQSCINEASPNSKLPKLSSCV